MLRSEHRILTTHVGSLIRPAVLTAGAPPPCTAAMTPDQAQLAHDLRHAVDSVVARQVATGLDIVNDGEFGKSGWATYVLERVTGFEIRQDQLKPLLWLDRDRERFAEFFCRRDAAG